MNSISGGYIAAAEYAAQAVIDIPKTQRQLVHVIDTEYKTHRDILAADRFSRGLLRAQHFVLPDGGLLLDDGLKGISDTDSIRLPYPVISLAFRSTDGSTKGVFLATECVLGDACQLDGLPAHNLRDRSVIEIETGKYEPLSAKGIWIQIAKVVPLSDQHFVLLPTSVFLFNPWRAAITESKEQVLNASIIYTSPAIWSCYYDAWGEPYQKILVEAVQDACEICLSFIEALTCRNVITRATGSSSSPSNARRVRNGKLPIFETKMLIVDVPGVSVEPSADGVRQCDRHGPRAHLRRGHIRRLASGNIWINSMIVAARNGGWIEKGYDIHGGETAERKSNGHP